MALSTSSRPLQPSGEASGSDIVIAVRTFTLDPGPRLRSEGKHSGQEYREDHLSPTFERAQKENKRLIVDLDGTWGYPISFLEEAFGGLVRNHMRQGRFYNYRHELEIITKEEPYLYDRVWEFIDDMAKK